mmetsp:Transcript_86963/g.246536  ORF Transcript_86963/g.246536 Transcript_86963/m.246536 type:complete len:262 (+) Transcript_86963:1164-1949(+)
MHLGVVRGQRLLVPGLEHGDGAAGAVFHEVRATQAIFDEVRSYAYLEGLDRLVHDGVHLVRLVARGVVQVLDPAVRLGRALDERLSPISPTSAARRDEGARTGRWDAVRRERRRARRRREVPLRALLHLRRGRGGKRKRARRRGKNRPRDRRGLAGVAARAVGGACHVRGLRVQVFARTAAVDGLPLCYFSPPLVERRVEVLLALQGLLGWWLPHGEGVAECLADSGGHTLKLASKCILCKFGKGCLYFFADVRACEELGL